MAKLYSCLILHCPSFTSSNSGVCSVCRGLGKTPLVLRFDKKNKHRENSMTNQLTIDGINNPG